MSCEKEASIARELRGRVLGIVSRMKTKASASDFMFCLAIFVVLLAFGLRLYRLQDKDVWWDEGWSVWLARQDLVSIASRTASDEHPPLHYWLLNLWDGVVGEGQFALRFSSVVFAVLAVALVNRLGTALVNRPMGTLASLLLALSRFHIWWSQEIKMYALAIFLSLLSLYLFVRILQRGTIRIWIAYIIVSIACVYTLYLTFFVLAIENLAFFLIFAVERPRPSLKGIAQWVMAQFTILLLFLPWLYFYYTRSIAFKSLEGFDPLVFFRLYATVLPLGISIYVERYQVLAILFLALATVGIISSLLSRRRGEKRVGIMLALAFLLPPLGIFAFSLIPQSIFHPKVMARYFVLFIPLYALILAQGIRFLWRRSWLIGGIALALVIACFSFTLRGYFAGRQRTYDLEAMATLIDTQAEEGDVILLNSDSDWPVYTYYIKTDLPWVMIPSGAKMTPKEAEHWLGTLKNRSTVWLLRARTAATSDPGREVKAWLGRYFTEVGEVAYGRRRLSLFSRQIGRDFCTVSQSKLSIQCSQPLSLGKIKFLGYDQLPDNLRTGDTIYLTSYWQAMEDLDGVPPVTVSLIDGEGSPLAWRPAIYPPTKCRWPEGTVAQMQHRITVGPSVPSGSYKLCLNLGRPPAGDSLTLPIKTLRIQGETSLGESEAPLIPTAVLLDHKVRLAGYSLSPNPVKPGQKLSVTLLWEALDEMDVSYTVFVHLLDENQRVWDQRDSVPGGGRYPTTGWMPGDSIEDDYVFDIPLTMEPEQLAVEVGMYDLATGVRLPMFDEEGRPMQDRRFILETVRIEK